MAGFGAKKGERRGGRAKGVLNKGTRELIDTLDELGYSPVADLVETSELAKQEFRKLELAREAYEKKRADEGVTLSEWDTGKFLHADAHTWLTVIRNCASELLPYLHPKRKSVEHTGAGGKPIEVTQVSFYIPENGRKNNSN